MQSRDRNTFIGAFNFLYDKMLEANPKVRIIIAGYHENESNNYVGPENNKKLLDIMVKKFVPYKNILLTIMDCH